MWVGGYYHRKDLIVLISFLVHPGQIVNVAIDVSILGGLLYHYVISAILTVQMYSVLFLV